jgi:hypothetical protein
MACLKGGLPMYNLVDLKGKTILVTGRHPELERES